MRYPTSYRVSPREYEVWELVAHGASYTDIARILGITMHTVKNHTSTLLRVVGVQSSLELAVVWFGGDLLRPLHPEFDLPRIPDRATPLVEKVTLFPTHGACTHATGLTADERAARTAAHPWRHRMALPRGDVLPARD